jgi:hypothetical protein
MGSENKRCSFPNYQTPDGLLLMDEGNPHLWDRFEPVHGVQPVLIIDTFTRLIFTVTLLNILLEIIMTPK